MGPWCRIITIVALHAKLLLATLPRFPSESSRSDASHVSKQRTPSPLAIQKTQVFEAVENGRQRLRARRLSLNVTKGQIPIWKDRRFQQRRTCSKTADCEPNDYCMSCAKCAEYHAHLPKEQQRRWTCDPCGDTEHICESGKYCTVAQDPVEGSCPSSYPGCSDHAECGADEYCFSCQKCDEYINTKGDNQSIWRCEPCPTTKGGFCSKLWWCPLREDSITGSCPAEQGCGKHSDCKEGEFCEGCQKCLDFQASLSESARANWPCEPCPTTEGGICEPTRLCQLGNTGIDGTCPPEKGCNSHVQCLPDEYCMDCQKCEAYRDSLSESQRAYWPCGYCPTGRGGHCERRIFCSVADDGVSECPLYEGCFKHQDCKDHEFCWSWKKCQEEDVQNSGTCGDKPRKDGFCNVMSTCNTRRSIDGQCRGAKACNSHRECGDGLYCVSWSKCNERSPDICGPEPAHRAGICLPIEHCVHGFHPPLGGECPAWSAHNGSAGGHLEVSEVLKLNSTLMLAVWGQAMNSWRWIRPNQERDLMLAHLHDYASNSTVLDDSEHVGIYEVTAGKMQQQDQVQLSCPFVEVAIPAHGPRFYEVLDLMQGLELGHAPPVLAAVHVPMSPGSIIRDVQCNDQRLCLVSLSWDGVAVIDMAEGPNRFKVIAEHSATFAGWASPFQGELAEDLAYLRMVVGAQKVVASRSRRNRFYIERWSFDMEGWSTNGGKLMDSLRFDSIWAVDVENYVRPTFDVAFAPDFDPAVSGRLIMPRVSWARVSAQMREFEIKMIKGLQEALKVDPARIKVLSSKRSGEGDEGVEMDFTILDGKGSSPETLFNALWRQLTLPFSALHRSQIKEEVSGASLIRVGPLPISLQQSRSIARVMHPDPTDGFFRVLLVLALLVLAGFTLWLLVRSKNAMNKLREENRQLKADLHRHTELAGNAPLAHATGYVIGRPESHQGSPSGKDPDARDTAGSLSYVVGSPIPEPPAREAPSAQSVQARDASDQPEDKPPAEQDGVASTVRAPTKPVGSD